MLDNYQVDLSCLADILCLQCLAAEILDIKVYIMQMANPYLNIGCLGYCRECIVHNADGQSRGVKVAPLARQVTGDPLSFEHVQLTKKSNLAQVAQLDIVQVVQLDIVQVV